MSPDQTAPATARIIAAVASVEGPLAPKKKLVIEAALTCFAEMGFAATSTRLIATRAGVAEATIFRHFETKKALLMRIATPVVQHLLAPAAEAEAVKLAAAEGGDLRSFMKGLMVSRLRFADEFGPFVQIMLQELPVNPDLRDMMHSQIDRESGGLFNIISQAFQRFQTQGQLRDIPAERLARWGISLLVGYYVNRTMIAPGVWDDDAETEAMLDMMLGGIGR